MSNLADNRRGFEYEKNSLCWRVNLFHPSFKESRKFPGRSNQYMTVYVFFWKASTKLIKVKTPNKPQDVNCTSNC